MKVLFWVSIKRSKRSVVIQFMPNTKRNIVIWYCNIVEKIGWISDTKFLKEYPACPHELLIFHVPVTLQSTQNMPGGKTSIRRLSNPGFLAQTARYSLEIAAIKHWSGCKVKHVLEFCLLLAYSLPFHSNCTSIGSLK